MIRERETVKKFLQYLAAPKFIKCMHSLLIFFNFTDLVIDAVVDCGIPGLCYKFNYSCQQASSGSVNSFADCCSKGGKSFKPYGSFRRQCSEHNINMIILIIAIRIWVGGEVSLTALSKTTYAYAVHIVYYNTHKVTGVSYAHVTSYA